MNRYDNYAVGVYPVLSKIPKTQLHIGIRGVTNLGGGIERPNTKGNGYLAGEFPDGITTVDGVPVNATVRVLLRTVAGHPGDGSLVAEVESAPDGSWRVDGLSTGFKYDVVGRKAGFNDVIMADISPAVG